MAQHYRITLLPGDGIGPEIMTIAVEVLKVIGQQFDLTFDCQEALVGGRSHRCRGQSPPGRHA